MSFFCNEKCKTRTGIARGVCISCPTAEYYRNLYEIDERGRPFIRTIKIPLPINLPNINTIASGFFVSTYTTSVEPMKEIPFNSALNQSYLNAQLPQVQIVKAGNYLVSYIINATTGGSVAIKVGEGIVAGTTISSPNVIVGTAVINVGFIPANVSVLNVGVADINIMQSPPNGVSAQFTITQII